MTETKRIGTLNEKSTHAFIKRYITEDKSCYEIQMYGYIADILKDGMIYEIQSKDFGRLRQKLDCYLANNRDVTIVYPVSTVRYLNWVDPSTDIVVERKRVYSGYNEHSVFKELYKIRNYLSDSHIHIRVISLEVEDYKYLDGYGPNGKNRATKIDKIPSKVIGDITFGVSGGYEKFIPSTLGETFTSDKYAKAIKSKLDITRVELLILTELGYLARVGKQDRRYIYKRIF